MNADFLYGFAYGFGIGTVVAWLVACLMATVKEQDQCSECWLTAYKAVKEEVRK
jgi:hypothetical protein